MKRLRAQAVQRAPGAPSSSTAPSSGGERVIPLVASSEAIDSFNEIVDQATWKLDRFAKNPIALWQHAPWEPPVGFYRNVRVEQNELRADLVLYTGDVAPEADRIWKRYQQGGPVAFSVGFDPGRAEDTDVGGKKIRRLFDNDLTEISVVTIGANPDAVAAARKSARAFLSRTQPRPASRAKTRKDKPMGLKELFGEKGLTPEDVAAKADMPLETLTALMDGQTPDEAQADALAKALGMGVSDLLPLLVADEEEEEAEGEQMSAKALLKLLGVKTMAEAAVKVKAMQDNGTAGGDLKARLARLEKTHAERERDEILTAARRDGRLTPAREKKNAAFIAGLSTSLLKTYLSTLEPAVGQLAPASLPTAPATHDRDMPSDADLESAAKAAGLPIERLKKSRDLVAQRNAAR